MTKDELELLWRTFCAGWWAAGGTSDAKAKKAFDRFLENLDDPKLSDEQ